MKYFKGFLACQGASQMLDECWQFVGVQPARHLKCWTKGRVHGDPDWLDRASGHAVLVAFGLVPDAFDFFLVFVLSDVAASFQVPIPAAWRSP